MIYVSAPSRIHITLISMTDERRIDGGVGFAINYPRTLVRARYGDCEELLGVKACVDVIERPPRHMGFGSGTQLALARAKAVAELYGMDLSVRELAAITGRGGTSGIGVAVFERGGFVLDAGHKWEEKGSFLPSSASPATPPKVILQRPMPKWGIILVFPRGEGRFFGEREVEVFKKLPLKKEEVEKLSYIILMKLLPSLIDDDPYAFGEAINEIQNVGFKRIENEIQPKEVRDAMRYVKEKLGNAGLSSMGHLIYSVVPFEESRKAIKKVEELRRVGFNVLLTFPNNEGHKVFRWSR